MPHTPQTWHPDSWRQCPIVQQPNYADEDARLGASRRLAARPPLVTPGEVERMRREFAAAARGECFVLQGGDCAESFAECQPDIIANRLRVLLQMSLVLVHGLNQRVVRVGRFAGQYAKPRSAETEVRNGLELACYRGDIVNSPEFTATAREPDPERLLQAHAQSAITLNYVRALIEGGFADLHHPGNWDLDWVQHSGLAVQYRRLVKSIGDSVSFMEMVAGRPVQNLDRVEFFTSHEALLLEYESALTRQPAGQEWVYNLGCHFPWIGMRTAALGDAHIEYCRGIRNPVGVKLGPGMTRAWLQQLVSTLDPAAEAGRLVLIHRLGAGKIADLLPPMIETVQQMGHPALWICDPMHGNTRTADNGMKTRDFNDIRDELQAAFAIHERCGSRLGGVHLELTGENVTECVGGARALTEADLKRAYQSQVDPRLNSEQALELAMFIASAAA